MGKSQGASVNLDSFLDIMTCLVGVLVLIIILTGIDAAQIKVLIPTPMEYSTDKRPLFIEIRNNEMYRVPVDELQTKANEALRSITQQAQGNVEQVLMLMNKAEVGTDIYRVDLSFFLTGQFAIVPIAGVPGYPLPAWDKEGPSDWYGSILMGMNKEQEMVTFLVRDDSFRLFKEARHLAWMQKIDVSYELLGSDDVIKFGLLGARSRPQ
jgi:biopolymer transport protein ExbD